MVSAVVIRNAWGRKRIQDSMGVGWPPPHNSKAEPDMLQCMEYLPTFTIRFIAECRYLP